MNDSTKKPFNFDWVSAREKCSLKEAFESLRLGIKDDVEKRNANRPPNPDDIGKVSLSIVDRSRTIRVFWNDMYGSYRDSYVEFNLTPQAIIIGNNEGPLFEARIGLNDDGDCKFIIGDKEFDVWQVQRKALERLMFDGPR